MNDIKTNTTLPVNNQVNAKAAKQVKAEQSQADNTGNTNTGASTSADTVSVTSEADKLRQLEQKLSALPAVDSERVEAVRQSIAEGTFSVNPDRIAEKLLQFELGQ